MSDAAWYVTIGGREHGPLTAAQLKKAALQGKITPASLVRKEGMAQGVPASRVKGLFDAPPPAETPVASNPMAGLLDEYESEQSATADESDEYGLAAEEPPAHTTPKPLLQSRPDLTSEPEERRRRTAGNFFLSLPSAFVYPFLGTGSLAIFGMSFAIVMIPSLIPRNLALRFLVHVPAAPYLIMLLILLIYAYIAAYVYRIGSASALGDDTPPAMPDFGRFSDDVGNPAMLFAATWLLCMLPYMAYMWNHFLGGGPFQNLLLTFVKVHILALTWPVDAIGWILRVLGLVYFPMALMVVMAQGSLAGLNPQTVVRAISRVPLAYPVVVLFMSLKFVIFDLIVKLTGMMEKPNLLAAVMLVALIVYLLMVQGRMLGLLYWTNRKKLDFII